MRIIIEDEDNLSFICLVIIQSKMKIRNMLKSKDKGSYEWYINIHFYSTIVIECIKAIEKYIEGKELNNNIKEFLEDIKKSDERLEKYNYMF